MKNIVSKNDVYQGRHFTGDIIKLIDRVEELEALCKECADHLDGDIWRSIPNDSYLHRDLKKKGDGL